MSAEDIQIIMARKNLFDEIIDYISPRKKKIFELFKASFFLIALLIFNFFIYEQCYKRFYTYFLENIWNQQVLPNKENYPALLGKNDLSYEIQVKGIVSGIKDNKLILKAGSNEKELTIAPAYVASGSATAEAANSQMIKDWINKKKLNFEKPNIGDQLVVFMYSSRPTNPLVITKTIKVK